MLNHAVDHSSGTPITVQVKRTAVNVEIGIIDNGLGIFKKIQRAMRFDRFRTVVLDFQNVNQIGQAFADEMFRFFAHSHPGIDLQSVNANEEVLKMIRRAQNV
jgi:signal transduction histidine kinase